MNKIVFQLLLLPLLVSCNGRYNGKNAVLQVGDSIATIDNVTYYWQQFSEDSSRISAVKENSVVNECVVKGPAHGAIQCDDGNIYIFSAMTVSLYGLTSDIFLINWDC